jgi:hypothetical protein
MAVSVLVHITLCMYLPCTSKGWGPLRPRKSLYNSFYCQEREEEKSPFVGEREREVGGDVRATYKDISFYG